MTRRIDRRSFVAWPFRGVSHRPLLDLVDESWLCNEVEVLSNSLDRIASRSLVSSKTFGRLLESEEHLLLREITRGVRIDDQFPGWTPTGMQRVERSQKLDTLPTFREIVLDLECAMFVPVVALYSNWSLPLDILGRRGTSSGQTPPHRERESFYHEKAKTPFLSSARRKRGILSELTRCEASSAKFPMDYPKC